MTGRERKLIHRIVLLASLAMPLAACACAQSPEAIVKPPTTYDVASIKVNNSMSHSSSINFSGDAYRATNVTLEWMIEGGYDLKEDQLAGVPKWAKDTRFDIDAKISDPDPAALKKLTRQQRVAMVAQLLIDRFALKTHWEKRTLPVYNLVIAKGGTKLKDVSSADPERRVGGMGPGSMRTSNNSMEAVGLEIKTLTYSLSSQLEHTVIDKTGLTGKYDFTLNWQPAAGADASEESSTASIFTALEEQLGLKLEATKAPVDVLVVDHLEMPSEN